MPVRIPFTPEQVESLNGFQHSPNFDPWTCHMVDEEWNALCNTPLVATTEGLFCPIDPSHGIRTFADEYFKLDQKERHIKYKNTPPPSKVIPQGTWAHEFMANNDWKQARSKRDRHCGWCEHWHESDSWEVCEKCPSGKGCGKEHERKPHLGWGIGCPMCQPWGG